MRRGVCVCHGRTHLNELTRERKPQSQQTHFRVLDIILYEKHNGEK